MFEFTLHFRFASMLYQLYHSYIGSVISLEPPWSGVQIPAAPLINSNFNSVYSQFAHVKNVITNPLKLKPI